MAYELITVKQLPALEEHFKEIGAEIDAKVTQCQNMVVTEDNYKDIKKIRAELNKEAKTYAEDFRAVKAMVLDPWTSVEDSYKDNIRSKYFEADQELKAKIYEVEGELKAQKEAEIKSYYNEYAQSVGVDFVEWERTGIRVGLSDSKKSLKDIAKKTLDDIVADLAAIESLPQEEKYKLEVGAEYRQTLDLPRSLQRVADRYARLEEEKRRREEMQKLQEWEAEHAKELEEAAEEYAEEILEEEEPLQAPVTEEIQEEKVNVLAFTVEYPESAAPDVVDALKLMKAAGCTLTPLQV